ncbi:hypothetical protein P3W85_09235 [Cupriavidus basilensis]|uniref:Uncharacterized protein n=1 Tax=Cupriavidus basilensis TaxID=68895 RepID=A0ABT6AKM1_9BURK|nr:hypothetical protein [Cupriavidus basilensis]MDF3833131.1 hypothetical protein [Cupriavidus basilensis]
MESGVTEGIKEYRGYVVHVFCKTIKDGLHIASCAIWEDGAVVQDARSIGRNHATPDDAKAAAYEWARQWIDANS